MMFRTPRPKYRDSELFPKKHRHYDPSKYREILDEQIKQKKTLKRLNNENIHSRSMKTGFKGFVFTPKKGNKKIDFHNRVKNTFCKEFANQNKEFAQLTSGKKFKRKDHFQSHKIHNFFEDNDIIAQTRNFEILNSDGYFPQRCMHCNCSNKNNYLHDNHQVLTQRYEPIKNECDCSRQRYDSKKGYRTSRELEDRNNVNITEFAIENIRDNLKEKKLAEKKARFENYVKHDLPDELNNYIKNYFDCNFIKFK